MKLRTCVAPSGEFIFGLHEPHFRCANFRESDALEVLGLTQAGVKKNNAENFPPGTLENLVGDRVFEIPNAFPFRGTTFINGRWADALVGKPEKIRQPIQPPYSLSKTLTSFFNSDEHKKKTIQELFAVLPEPVCLALATTSSDPGDLIELARLSCRFTPENDTKSPKGLAFRTDASGRLVPAIIRPELFEAVANNPHLPDIYKRVMVLRPGVQGSSPIVGESGEPEKNHVWEYLRHNSYIPWGHYAANMAHDTVRYRIADLEINDIKAMRHLYVQRIYTRLAHELEISHEKSRRACSPQELEDLRKNVARRLMEVKESKLSYDASLWGWNYGFDYAPSFYRLHASHQQIHQQYSLIPSSLTHLRDGHEELSPFSFGDMVTQFIAEYKSETGRDFFSCYLEAISKNSRTDGLPDKPDSLVVFEDANVILFVPKAQTSQWELQLMAKNRVGNILEADLATRDSLDRGIFTALRTLGTLGAKMVSTIEISSRFQGENPGHHLMYAFLPRLPESPGAFSEAQLRWINGHYPEDFATACRTAMAESSFIEEAAE